MEQKGSKALQIITYANLLLICACIVGCMYGIAITKNVFFVIDSLVEIVALVAAITYFAMGYKKDAAGYYKMFMLMQAATYVIEYFLSTFLPKDSAVTGIYTAVSLILYGNILLLGIAKDLGKKVTISLASFNLALYLGELIGACCRTYENQVYQIDSIILSATWFALAAITLLMTIVKYIDKAQRNTK